MGARFKDVGFERVLNETKTAIVRGRGDPYVIGELLGITRDGAMHRIRRLELLGDLFAAKFEAERSDPDYKKPGRDSSRPLWHMGEEGLE